MNYRQKLVTKLAKKEYHDYDQNLYNEFFATANVKNFIKIKEGKKLKEYFDRLKPYSHFKRKVSMRLRKERR